MGFRGGGNLTPPPSISWFSNTPAEIGLSVSALYLESFRHDSFVYQASQVLFPLLVLKTTSQKGGLNFKKVRIIKSVGRRQKGWIE